MTENKTIVPRAPYVLVKPIEPKDKKTEGEEDNALIIPDNIEEEQKAQGLVVRLPGGNQVANFKGIEEGDTVVYGAYSGEDLDISEGGETVRYKLIHDDDIIAFIK